MRIRHTHVVMGRGIVGLEPQGDAVLFQGCGKVPLLPVGSAEVVAGLGKVGLQLQEPFVLGNGAVDVSQLQQRDADVVVGGCEGRVKAKRLPVGGHSFRILLAIVVDLAELIEGAGLARGLGNDIAPENDAILPDPVALPGGECQEDDNGRHEEPAGGRGEAPAEEGKDCGRGHGHPGEGEVETVLEDDVGDRDDARLDAEGEEEPEDAEGRKAQERLSPPTRPHDEQQGTGTTTDQAADKNARVAAIGATWSKDSKKT